VLASVFPVRVDRCFIEAKSVNGNRSAEWQRLRVCDSVLTYSLVWSAGHLTYFAASNGTRGLSWNTRVEPLVFYHAFRSRWQRQLSESAGRAGTGTVGQPTVCECHWVQLSKLSLIRSRESCWRAITSTWKHTLSCRRSCRTSWRVFSKPNPRTRSHLPLSMLQRSSQDCRRIHFAGLPARLWCLITCPARSLALSERGKCTFVSAKSRMQPRYMRAGEDGATEGCRQRSRAANEQHAATLRLPTGACNTPALVARQRSWYLEGASEQVDLYYRGDCSGALCRRGESTWSSSAWCPAFGAAGTARSVALSLSIAVSEQLPQATQPVSSWWRLTGLPPISIHKLCIHEPRF